MKIYAWLLSLLLCPIFSYSQLCSKGLVGEELEEEHSSVEFILMQLLADEVLSREFLEAWTEEPQFSILIRALEEGVRGVPYAKVLKNEFPTEDDQIRFESIVSSWKPAFENKKKVVDRDRSNVKKITVFTEVSRDAFSDGGATIAARWYMMSFRKVGRRNEYSVRVFRDRIQVSRHKYGNRVYKLREFPIGQTFLREEEQLVELWVPVVDGILIYDLRRDQLVTRIDLGASLMTPMYEIGESGNLTFLLSDLRIVVMNSKDHSRVFSFSIEEMPIGFEYDPFREMIVVHFHDRSHLFLDPKNGSPQKSNGITPGYPIQKEPFGFEFDGEMYVLTPGRGKYRLESVELVNLSQGEVVGSIPFESHSSYSVQSLLVWRQKDGIYSIVHESDWEGGGKAWALLKR